MTTTDLLSATRIAFIGAGNMATALLGGLVRHGVPVAQLSAIDPSDGARAKLAQALGVVTLAAPDATLTKANLIVWAIKPQSFRAAAPAVAPRARETTQLSIMAGVRLTDIAKATGAHRAIRCMPNTPALIGQGMAALYAPPEINAEDRALAEAVMRCAGDTLWVEREEQLDAVTALSGSGPAYVFYFLEAMEQAGTELGLTREQARHLAVQTFTGSTALAAQSDEPLATLRERVTSKGGTTFAALQKMQRADVQAAIIQALHAARDRAIELGDAFGR